MGHWEHLDNEPVRPLWLDRTKQKYGDGDWSLFFGSLLYLSDREPVIQWIEPNTGAGLLMGPGKEPWIAQQSLEVLYASPRMGIWRMPLYNNKWYAADHKDSQWFPYDKAFAHVMEQVAELLTIENEFLDLFYPSAELDYFHGEPT